MSHFRYQNILLMAPWPTPYQHLAQALNSDSEVHPHLVADDGKATLTVVDKCPGVLIFCDKKQCVDFLIRFNDYLYRTSSKVLLILPQLPSERELVKLQNLHLTEALLEFKVTEKGLLYKVKLLLKSIPELSDEEQQEVQEWGRIKANNIITERKSQIDGITMSMKTDNVMKVKAVDQVMTMGSETPEQREQRVSTALELEQSLQDLASELDQLEDKANDPQLLAAVQQRWQQLHQSTQDLSCPELAQFCQFVEFISQKSLDFPIPAFQQLVATFVFDAYEVYKAVAAKLKIAPLGEAGNFRHNGIFKRARWILEKSQDFDAEKSGVEKAVSSYRPIFRILGELESGYR